MTIYLLQKAAILYILVGQLHARLLGSDNSNSNSNKDKDNKSSVTKINIKEEENTNPLGIILFSVLSVVGSIILILIFVIWLRRYRFKKMIQLENIQNQQIKEKASSISISQSFNAPNYSHQFGLQQHQESPLSLPQSQQIIGQNIIQPNQIQTNGVAQQLLPQNQNHQAAQIAPIQQQQPLSNGQNNDINDPYLLLQAQLGTNLILQKLIINMLSNNQDATKQKSQQSTGQSNLIINQNSNNASNPSVNHGLNRSKSRDDDVQIPNMNENKKPNPISSERNYGQQQKVEESTPTPFGKELNDRNAQNYSKNVGINLAAENNLNSQLNKDNFENKLRAMLEQNSQYLSSLKINLQLDKSQNQNGKEGFLQLPIQIQKQNEEESELKYEGDEQNNNQISSISNKIQRLKEDNKPDIEWTIQKIEQAVLEMHKNNQINLQFNGEIPKNPDKSQKKISQDEQEDALQNSQNVDISKNSIPEQQQHAACELLEKESIQLPGNTENQHQSDVNLLRPAVIGAKYQQLLKKINKNDPIINQPRNISTNDGSQEIQNPASLLCNQCRQNQLSTIFSCGHMTCSACSDKYAKICPFCDATITSKKPIFFC